MEAKKKVLSDLEIDDVAIIEGFLDNMDLSMRRRLLEIGFIPGTKIECLLISPFQDPKAYRIRNTLIAIRKEDSQKIKIKEVNEK